MNERKEEVIKMVSEMNLNPEMSRRERAHLQVEIGKMINNFEDFKRGLPKE